MDNFKVIEAPEELKKHLLKFQEFSMKIADQLNAKEFKHLKFSDSQFYHIFISFMFYEWSNSILDTMIINSKAGEEEEAIRLFLSSIILSLTEGRKINWTVSYTHLDVYKRQIR